MISGVKKIIYIIIFTFLPIQIGTLIITVNVYSAESQPYKFALELPWCPFEIAIPSKRPNSKSSILSVVRYIRKNMLSIGMSHTNKACIALMLVISCGIRLLHVDPMTLYVVHLCFQCLFLRTWLFMQEHRTSTKYLSEYR